LEAVQAVAVEAVMPIFKAMVEAAEEIMLRLHSEGFADEGQQGMTQASAYMQALTTHLTHCRSLLYLSSPCPSHPVAGTPFNPLLVITCPVLAMLPTLPACTGQCPWPANLE